MKIELWPVDKPQPYARNARKISDLAIEKVAVDKGFRLAPADRGRR
jgi:hypothetical protein